METVYKTEDAVFVAGCLYGIKQANILIDNLGKARLLAAMEGTEDFIRELRPDAVKVLKEMGL